MGAWIETYRSAYRDAVGLVAPYVGAWIETFETNEILIGLLRVAPYVGAWIETWQAVKYNGILPSHPMWVRGLKHSTLHRIPTLTSRTLCGCVD